MTKYKDEKKKKTNKKERKKNYEIKNQNEKRKILSDRI